LDKQACRTVWGAVQLKAWKKSMTDREAEYWDDYYTKNTIMPDLSKPGYFARKYGMSIKLDPETSRVIAAHAEAAHKTPAEIIAELVHREMAAEPAGK
jgi:hypothetical protein